MASPNRNQFVDIPISSFAGWDRVRQIEAVLSAHDYGQFRNSAILVDAMERDDRISGVMATRVGGLMAAPVEVKPATDKRKAVRIATEVGGDDDTTGILKHVAPDATMRALSSWGAYEGVVVAEILWFGNGQDRLSPAYRELPRLKLWHPQFVYWDWSERTFILITGSGMVKLPRIDVNPRSDGKWFVWAPFGFQYGWLRAIVRSIAFKYLMRQWNYRDWGRYNEVYGKPIKKGKVPASAKPEAKDRFEGDLVNMADDAVVMLPQGKDPETSYDLELLEAKSRGYQTFGDLKTHLDKDIAIAVLGQDLPSEAGGGGLGVSKGADIRDHVRLDKRVEDAAIYDALREQVFTWWALYNFGDAELAPRIEAQVIPEETETEENQGMLTLGNAVKALKDANPRTDVDAIYDRQGIPMLSDEEMAAKRAEAEKSRPQLPPGGGGAPGHGPAALPPAPGDHGPAAGDEAAHAAADGPEHLSAADARLPIRRREFAGLPVAIENPAGTVRLWTDANGKTVGSTMMYFDYGYIEGHVGSDDEELDVYLGPDETAPNVHIVHQAKAPEFKMHDEDKAFLGFASADDARAAYVAHRNDGDRAIRGMSSIPIERFKEKLRRRTGTGPIRASIVAGAAEVHVAERAILAMLDRAENATTLGAVRTKKGKQRAKTYGDAVADRAKRAAAKALAPDLEAVLSAISESSSPSDLRRRLPGILRGMDPAQIAQVTERARILGNLGGRLAARKMIEK
ncbi:MAG: DUF935 family protein [Phenylobacterium sp.]|uniref:phage portal protein family protein n=1 Tax=Phenylobacterium sp. TaxID=1871053 RepID=UPI00121BE747|nr:DUF935 family protein [Phenylobacterium sp.]TAL29002.1 MAG: DUF935 family protein [Phenylobacterium sp.]